MIAVVMKLRDILHDPELSSLTKGFVYYLEAQEYIKPHKLQRGQVKRREYSPDDLRVIKQMWTYHRHGIPPARAFELLDRPPLEIPKSSSHQSLLAFILLIYQPAPPAAETRSILKVLRKIRGVQEVAGVYGSVDIILKVEVNDLPSLYELVHTQITSVAGLKDARSGTLIVIDSQFHWDRSSGLDTRGKTLAFILLQAFMKDTYGFLNILKEFPEILEAAVVYSEEADIVAKVAVKGLAELTVLVRHKLVTVPGIGKVTTFVVPDQAHLVV